MSAWVHVSERLPVADVPVLIWRPRGISLSRRVVYADGGYPEWVWDAEECDIDAREVAWWMPLPAPPEVMP